MIKLVYGWSAKELAQNTGMAGSWEVYDDENEQVWVIPKAHLPDERAFIREALNRLVQVHCLAFKQGEEAGRDRAFDELRTLIGASDRSHTHGDPS